MDNIPPLYYRVYYMNNDRQKIIVARGLLYSQAVRFCQNHRQSYNADLQYEVQE